MNYVMYKKHQDPTHILMHKTQKQIIFIGVFIRNKNRLKFRQKALVNYTHISTNKFS